MRDMTQTTEGIASPRRGAEPMRRGAAGALLALLAAGPALAGSALAPLPDRIAGADAAVPPGWRQEVVARGDLDGDGRPDLALLLRGDDPGLARTGSGGRQVDDNPRVLAVYFAEKGGGYRLAVQDRRLVPAGIETAHDPITGIAGGGVTIVRGLLQVSLGTFGSSVGSDTFSFRWQKDRFVLTGYDSISTSRTTNTVTEDSYNYLTARHRHSVERTSDAAPEVGWNDLPRRRGEALSEIGDGLAFDPLAPPPIPKAAWSWADAPKEGYSDDPALHATQEICAGLRHLRPPAGDVPGRGEGAPAGRCDSRALYYGIGETSDPAKARACAFYEIGRADLGEDPFSGTGMLMTIYANGRGAARDLDLATALACRVPGAPAELDGRIRHLQAMKANPSEAKTFDYCDDITSGLAGAQCAARDADMADSRRDARIDAMTAGWREPDRTAFAPLRRAAETYARVSADNEVDMSGTARGMFAIERREAVLDAFTTLLAKLEAGHLPPAGKRDARRADAALNRVYRKIMAIRLAPGDVSGYQSADSLPSTTVTHDGIRTAERAWIAYRDAWTAFAARRFPALAPARLAAYLTRERITDLEPFAEEN